MFKLRLFLVFLLMLGICAHAFALDAETAEGLNVQVAVTDAFRFSDWSKKKREKRSIKTINEVKPEQTFYIGVLVSGFGIDNQGAIDLTADLTLRSPDGKVYYEQKNACRSKGVIPPDNIFVMLNPTLDFILKKDDYPGIYALEVMVKDNILNNAARGEYKLALVNDNSLTSNLPRPKK